MKLEELQNLLKSLIQQSNENEWLEFKLNYHSDIEIGERISALSNAACIHQQSYAYLVFGIEDKTHTVIGTDFKPKFAKAKGEKGVKKNSRIG